MPKKATSTTESTTEQASSTETSGGGATETQATTGVAEAKQPTLEEVADALAAAKKVNTDLEAKLKRSDDNRTRVQELEAQIAKFEGREAEHEKALADQKVKDEALAAANARIAAAELRAAAKGKVADDVLSDIHLFINPSNFEVKEDGSVDTEAITAAVTDLINKKPSLAAQGGRFQGHGDGGARKETQQSIDHQIAEATKAGNHALAISLKRHKAQAASN